MSTSPATTATVELLTAEVHIVMYDGQRLSLGEYRQLDRVASDKIEPFGRVRDNRDDPDCGIYIIGRDRSDGALVRSALAAPSSRVDQDIPAVLRERPLFRMRRLHYGPTTVDVGRNSGVTVYWPTLPSSLRIEDPTMASCNEWAWASEEIRSRADRYIAAGLREQIAKRRRFQLWESLPLIVLAGRR